LIIPLTRPRAALLGQRFDPAEARNLRRNFTVVVRSFTGGRSSNQMEDANTDGAVSRPFITSCAVQPDRGRVRRSINGPGSVEPGLPFLARKAI